MAFPVQNIAVDYGLDATDIKVRLERISLLLPGVHEYTFPIGKGACAGLTMFRKLTRATSGTCVMYLQTRNLPVRYEALPGAYTSVRSLFRASPSRHF